MRHLAVVGAISLAVAGCCACGRDDGAVPEESEEIVMDVPAVTWDPEGFLERVTNAGGRADFVFADDRPFAQCHASTVVETVDGDLICAWFGGTEEKDPDVGVWYAWFRDAAWSTPEPAAKVSQTAHWNPVLFRDAADGIHLFFKVGVDVPRWSTYCTTRDAAGRWGAPRELAPGDVGGRGPVKNKAIILSDGAWLAPASTERPSWRCFADRSEDGGTTWQRTDDFPMDRKLVRGSGAIQPTFWESAPGHVHALMRTSAGFIARSDSNDGGRTWSPLRASGLPNNNSGIDAVRLEDGRVLLVYNPVGENWGDRTPLDLAVSDDNGETWRGVAALETDEGEYSYPSIVRTSRGVAVTYTWRRERVRCWQIPLSAL